MATKRKRDRPSAPRIDTYHFLYRIIAGQRESKCQAIAYVGRQKLDAIAGETVALAVEAMKQSLDERLSHLRRQRVDGVPSEAEYREGLLALTAVMQDDVLVLLRLHRLRPAARASLNELARASGQNEGRIAECYARLGRRLGDLLQYSPHTEGRHSALAPMATFAFLEPHSRNGSAVLRLRPEVVEALQLLGDR